MLEVRQASSLSQDEDGFLNVSERDLQWMNSG